MRVLIVGGVAAGMSAAARLRRLDDQAEIVVFERDRYVSFANCGLPYHIGGVIAEREKLLVVTPEHLRDTLRLDVRTEHEVVAIDRAGRTITVHNRRNGTNMSEPYDILVLAQGAEPLRPPVPGLDHPGVLTLRNIDDMDRIKAQVDGGAARAVVIGGSYIGIEMVEALHRRGLQVELVELQDQVLPLFDPELAAGLAEHLREQGVGLHLGVSASMVEDDGGRVRVTLGNGTVLTADMVVLSAGVRPASALARAAGLVLGPRGGLQVDGQLRTSDPRIFAAGDMVEVIDTVTHEQAIIALAGPANRQGRIIADAIAGRGSAYFSTQGTAIIKVLEHTAAMTGASEKTLRRLGRPFRKVYLHPGSHAGYYPGAEPMQIKLLFDPNGGAILGAQIMGGEGVDKRIDVLATALRGGMTVFDLEQLELAYAPPYSSAKDPVNMAGFIAANLLRGDVRFWYAEEPQPEPTLLVDVRDPHEYAAGHLPGALNIPLSQLRAQVVDLVASGQPLRIYCMVGFRSYLAYRMLVQQGATDVATLAGGLRTYLCVHQPEPGSPELPGPSSVTIVGPAAMLPA